MALPFEKIAAMETSQNTIETTASKCAPQMVRGRHVFEIAGYSLHKGLGNGNQRFVRSATFTVGGHDWCIEYYPDGNKEEDYVSASLVLISSAAEVRAFYDFRLVNLVTMQCTPVKHKRVPNPTVFSSLQPRWGYRKLWKKDDLKGLPFLRDDRVVLECEVTVIMGTPVSESRPMHMSGIQVPPSELVENLGNLLEDEEGADVTFKVEDQVFHAHKIVLAMRSPVFKVQLYGPMSDKAPQQDLTVEDMQPDIFKALLHCIYTDTLPVMDSLDEDENEDMVKHLLAAADRYGLERMKVMCDDILCKRLDVQTVTATLAIADQHHCSRLKDACIQFINSSSLTGDLMASQGMTTSKGHVLMYLSTYGSSQQNLAGCTKLGSTSIG